VHLWPDLSGTAVVADIAVAVGIAVVAGTVAVVGTAAVVAAAVVGTTAVARRLRPWYLRTPDKSPHRLAPEPRTLDKMPL